MILGPLDKIQVVGQTPLLTDWGYRKAEDLAKVPKQKNKVWDGTKFQPIQIKELDEEYPLIRVWLSNGTYLDCGGQHEFKIVEQDENQENKKEKLVKAIDLEPNMRLPAFKLPLVFEDIHLPLMASYIDRMGTYLRTRPDGLKEVVFPCHLKKEETAESILGQIYQMLHYLSVDTTWSMFNEDDEDEDRFKYGYPATRDDFTSESEYQEWKDWIDRNKQEDRQRRERRQKGLAAEYEQENREKGYYSYSTGQTGANQGPIDPESLRIKSEPKKCLLISPPALERLMDLGMETPELKVPRQNVEPMEWISLNVSGTEILEEKAQLYGLDLR